MINQLPNACLGSRFQRFFIVAWYWYLQACGKDRHHGASTWQRKMFILQWPRSNKRDKEGDGTPISSLKAYLGDIHNIRWWRLLSSIRAYLLRASHFLGAPQTGDSAMCKHLGANIQGLNYITQDFCSLPPSQLFVHWARVAMVTLGKQKLVRGNGFRYRQQIQPDLCWI